MIYVALCAIVVLGFLLWDAYRRYDRLIGEIEAERRAHEAVVSELLTRIQAPELAPTLSAPDPSDEPLYVSPDSDEAWTEYAEDRTAGKVN